MKFLFPCEEIVRKYLPAMRASIAKKLYKKGFTQEKIAEELGLTQAAVSKYLSGQYGDNVRRVEKEAAVDKASQEIAEKIVAGNWNYKQTNRAICSTCNQFNFDLMSCNLIENFAKSPITASNRVS